MQRRTGADAQLRWQCLSVNEREMMRDAGCSRLEGTSTVLQADTHVAGCISQTPWHVNSGTLQPASTNACVLTLYLHQLMLCQCVCRI